MRKRWCRAGRGGINNDVMGWEPWCRGSRGGVGLVTGVGREGGKTTLRVVYRRSRECTIRIVTEYV